MGKKTQPIKIKKEQTENKHLTITHSVKKQNQLPTSEPQQQSQNTLQLPQKRKIIKHARLIIRNLVYDINEKHIRKLMSQCGTVKQVNIPNHPDNAMSKGFAFVEMSNRNECLKAIKMLNGTLYKGRTIVLDMAVSKENFMTEKLNESQQKQEKRDTKMENDNENVENGQKFPQQQYVKEAENISQKHKKQYIKKQENQSELEDNEIEGNQHSEEEENQQSSDTQQQQQQQQRLLKQKEDHLHQIFIRNIPIQIEENDLFNHFVRYGKINFVKIVRNKQTNLSKGSAFIKFANAEISQKLIQYSKEYQMQLSKKNRNFVVNPNINLEMDGAVLKIFPVQNKTSLKQKLEAREGLTNETKKHKPVKRIKRLEELVKVDIYGKRRLQLALIGRWKAEEGMNKYDYEMFRKHEKEKLQKLKNHNFSISPTRIILKHLERDITQERLKTVCTDFLSERKYSKNFLQYCKLMLSSNMKKSAGFAFIEFRNHETSKQFIQYLKQHYQILQKKLFIIQFAIQNSQTRLKLKRREERKGDTNDTKQSDHQKKIWRNKTIKKGAIRRKNVAKRNVAHR